MKDLTNEKLYEIKLFYIITRLLGYGTRVNIPYIPKDFKTGITYDVRVCMRLLNSYLWEKIKLHRIEKDEIVMLTVYPGCKDDPCDYYKTMYKNKTFEIKDAPELPCYYCAKETGCYCNLSIHHLGYKS